MRTLTREANYAFAAPLFAQKFGRLPLNPRDHDATINDLIFSRMVDPQWSALQRTLVDKSTAKTAAERLYPGLRAPKTLATIKMDTIRSLDHLGERLGPFVGSEVIAKPSHASGGTVFMRDITAPTDLRNLYDVAMFDYALVMREMQYWRLPRRIIVEALVPVVDLSPPDDFKFHCIHGEPLLCQIDHARFGEAWSRVFRVPGFEPMDANDGLIPPAEYTLPDATRLAIMTESARALAAPFDYVRVDLYNGTDGIYFGEMTFTPGASLGIAPSAAGCDWETPTHREYSRTLMSAIRLRD